MTDYAKQVAELLQKGETVVYYTVGSDTFLNIRELKVRFGLLPTAVCDKDPKKQGRTWKGLEEIPVISPEDAMQQFPKAWWFIPSLDFRYQIIGYLTQECGIPQDYIINYTPVRKVKTCEYLQKAYIYDRNGKMGFCWREVRPEIPASKNINVVGLRTLRNSLLRAIKEDCLPKDSPCANCAQIKEDYYPVEPKGWSINYFCHSVCNYHCSYCTVSHAPAVKDDEGRQTLCEVLDALKEEDMLDESYQVGFSTAGEPTLHPSREETYRAFDGANFTLNTNGFFYDPALFEMMEQKKVLIIDSIDAGTKALYKQIKGVDGFDRVRQNLKKYAQATMGIVALKYIFIPGVNDTMEEIRGFIDYCVDIDAVFVIISLDLFSKDRFTDHTREMVQQLKNGLSRLGIMCVPLMAYSTEEYREIMRFLFE